MDRQKSVSALSEMYVNGDLSRRSFLRSLGLMAAASGVFGAATNMLAQGPAHAADAVRFDGYGGISQGAYDKYVFKELVKKTGITLNQGSYSTPYELLTKITADGPGVYNYFACSDEVTLFKFRELGHISSFDAAKVPRLADLSKRAVGTYRDEQSGEMLAVPFVMSGIAIAYNKNLVDASLFESQGFNILLDPEFKGRISGEDSWLKRIWYGALQSGQDPNDIQDMEAVWQKIRESRSIVTKYWKTGSENTQLLSGGDIAISDSWFTTINTLKARGEPIEYWPRQGSYVSFQSFVALKDSPMEPFYEMVDILLRPDVVSIVGEEMGCVPLLDPVKHLPSAAIQGLPGFDPSGTLDGYRFFKPAYWNQHADEWQKMYFRLMARG